LRSRTLVPAIVILSLCASAQAATVRVSGNMTSIVRAIPSGGLPGASDSEHPGDTGWVPASPAGAQLFQDLSVAAVGTGAELHLSGHAQLGSLSISGSASAFFAPPQGQGASALGGIQAQWLAGITFLGGSELPNGTVVEVLATVVIHGDGVVNGNASNFLNAALRFGGLAPAIDLSCNDFTSSCDLTQSFVLQGVVGSTYDLSSSFSLGVSAHASKLPVTNLSSQAIVNASNTSALYLDVLTPGASYVLDDGSTLQGAPLPEPATTLLVPAAVLFAAGAARRRRRRR
jgi:hypothetical protein